MKTPRQSPVLVHDVVGKSASAIHIMKAPNSLLDTLVRKIAGLRRYHECGMINLKCAIHIHDDTTKSEWIWYEVHKNIENIQDLFLKAFLIICMCWRRLSNNNQVLLFYSDNMNIFEKLRPGKNLHPFLVFPSYLCLCFQYLDKV
jgi:hypothetical protein